jgi:hypothetical protein
VAMRISPSVSFASTGLPGDIQVPVPSPKGYYAPSPLEQLARISGWKSGTVVVVMWGFFDESGEPNAKGRLIRLTLGGFFAPWSEVEKLCIRWREALEAEGLGEFHMKDIASDEHNFDNWPAERQYRLRRFVEILCDHATEFGAFAYQGRAAHLFKDAYQPALNRILLNASTLCAGAGERGHVVFAQTDEIKTQMIGEYFDRGRWGEYLNGYSVSRSRGNPALQAAEIVARGMKRLMQDGGITYSFGCVRSAAARPGKSIRFWPPDPFAATEALGHSLRVLSGQK